MRKSMMVMLVLTMLVPMAVMASGGAEQEEAAGEQTIRFVWFTDGPDRAAIEGLVEDYEAENPDVEIDFSIVPFGELNQLLQT